MANLSQELQKALDITKYSTRDKCRVTMYLRHLEQGYNNNRPVSLNKQYIIRQEENIYNEQRVRKANPIYRLFYATTYHLQQLAKRIKLCLKDIGVHIAAESSRGLSKQIELAVVELVDEVYVIYKQTMMLQDEAYLYFEKNVRNYLTEYSGPEFVVIQPYAKSDHYHAMANLLYELDEQIDKVMSVTLRDEDDQNIIIQEFGVFNEYIIGYVDSLNKAPPVIQYKLEIHDPNKEVEVEQVEQVEVRADRDNKNYIKEFYDKFQNKLMKASPEYWSLLMFDILKDLCDKNILTSDLELKLFGLLKSVKAAQYLCIYRREIVKYLHQSRFWEAPQQKQQQKHQEMGETSNHRILAAIGIDVEKEGKLGLREQNMGKQKAKQIPTFQEGLVEFNPEEYVKMDQRKLAQIFPTSSKTERVEFIQVRIDPLPKKRIIADNLIPISTLPKWAQRAFDGTECLNVIQSTIFNKAFRSEDNILVCAPTGAGKTNVALLTILQEISKRIDENTMRLVDQDFKIVYISPMKALASEIVDKFQAKLKYLGIKVREFTGDMQLTRKELAETHIILTTPEKWDVITRKTNQVAEQLKLLIIDEVHLLNDERGPILECVVARTLQQVQRAQKYIRMVGLSATLPNYWDVAIFLDCHKEDVFFFDQTYRPVPLCQKFVGVRDAVQGAVQKGQRRRNKKDIYNEQAYEILSDVVKHGKQVLVFVHSRKETMKYANWILERAQKNNDRHVIPNTHINHTKVQDSELKKLLPYGLGFHHAGVLRSDRNSVERLFLEGHIRVLMATATLAWGVNLPAYAVIIKGTDIFDVTRADMQNLSVLDVQQMFGRAGRPQFDDQGEATLMTDYSNMGFYMSMLNNASYIESRLLVFLKEALNAEIVLGNITNYQEAYNWLNHTFLSIRLRRNPVHYGVGREFESLDINCDVLVHSKIENALMELDRLKMARFDKSRALVVSTELGRISSHYYVKCETMKIFCEGMGLTFDQGQNKYEYRTIYQLLRVLAKAKEFEMIRVKPEENKEIEGIYERNWVFEDEPTFDIGDQNAVIEQEEKVIALISGYIAQVQYENHALMIDTHIVIQNCIRLCRCMLEMAIKKNQASMTKSMLLLCKLIENRMSETQNPVYQFSKEIFQGYNSRKVSNHQDGYIPTTFLQCISYMENPMTAQKMYESSTDELKYILKCQHSQAGLFKRYLEYLPSVDVQFQVKPIAQTIIQIVVQVKPEWTFSQRWHFKQEPFWIFVDDDQELLHAEEFMITSDQVYNHDTIHISFFVPFNQKHKEYTLRVTSDRWIMREEYELPIYLGDISLQEDQMDFTELLDLQPLPTQVLGDPTLEQLYPYKYFNPIQTQVFYALYQTDDNVLVGAPTGSGKTIMAEFAMLRVFKHYANKKVVYVAPMKALAKERLKDWTGRLKGINKSVLELTGDFTPDLAALMSADVLITTPEKWDGISRNWNTRSYVRQTGLLIFDEIHLLGQDRGPVLEVIVSRMNLIASQGQHKTRMIGLSTAMANGIDVSNWFGVPKHRFYNFKPSCRPVPVTIHFNGFPERAYCPRMATMNKPAYQDIKRYSEGKPTIVFVSSRRQTRLTAMDLIALAVQEGNDKQYILCTREKLQEAQKIVDDEQLKQTLEFGIGMHHSGLSRKDRQLVEDMFVKGQIQVLIATSTLAWGVNFPARLVIIKGTEYFDPKEKKYVDVPVTDLLQMIGRAGRPQFDTVATACVYVEQSKKNFYRKYLNSPFPIESSLLTQLSDHINAEISAGVITNNSQLIDWISWTYFFRRLIKNPTYYGAEGSDKDKVKSYLNQIVDETIKSLVNSKCIHAENNQYSIQFLGKMAAFYYVKHQTVLHYATSITADISVENLIRTVAYSEEFEDVPVRHNEDNLNEMLAKLCPLKANMKQMDNPKEKTFLLLQSHLFRLPVPIKDFETDTKLVLDSCIRMLHCMIDIAAEKQYLGATLNCIRLMQYIVQGYYPRDTHPYNIIGNIPNLEHCRYDQIKSTKELMNSYQNKHFKDYIYGLKLKDDAINEVYQAIRQIPQLDVSQTINNNKIRVQLNNRNNGGQNQRVLIQALSKIKDASWWIIVGQQDRLVALKKTYFQKSVSKELDLSDYQLPLTLYVMSDSYIGLDQEIRLN